MVLKEVKIPAGYFLGYLKDRFTPGLCISEVPGSSKRSIQQHSHCYGKSQSRIIFDDGYRNKWL